jgi:hypothetical protein
MKLPLLVLGVAVLSIGVAAPPQAPGRPRGLILPSTPPPTPTNPALVATSQWVSIVPLDSEHSRVTVVRGGDAGEIICDAKSATISYTAEGMVVEIKGPGTMTEQGRTPVPFDSVRVGFANGKYTALELRSGASFYRR